MLDDAVIYEENRFLTSYRFSKHLIYLWLKVLFYLDFCYVNVDDKIFCNVNTT